jgi:hypothetical protein
MIAVISNNSKSTLVPNKITVANNSTVGRVTLEKIVTIRIYKP